MDDGQFHPPSARAIIVPARNLAPEAWAVTFYQECPVWKEEDEAVRTSRLLLCDLTARTLTQGLTLLGIDAPKQM